MSSWGELNRNNALYIRILVWSFMFTPLQPSRRDTAWIPITVNMLSLKSMSHISKKINKQAVHSVLEELNI